MRPDGPQAVVVEQLTDLRDGDRADVALGVARELDLGVADVGELLEHGPEAERADLVAHRVELDADAVDGDEAVAAAARCCGDAAQGGRRGRADRRAHTDGDRRGREGLEQVPPAHRASRDGLVVVLV
ncbi:hypothetical protein D3C74_373990 [compost metagenome]